MKNILLLTFLFTPAVFVSATSYNYLPNDVYIKQQEEKAALEFRISQLEAGISGNLSSSISNIEYRIDQLENEMATEINYVTGLYGGYGIANQLPQKISEIEAKYEDQISNLEEQRDELKQQLKDAESAQNEIERLEAEVSALNKILSAPPAQETTQSQSDLQKPSAQSMFEHIDSLPLGEASDAFGDLKIWDPEMYADVLYLVNLKYPHGKPGSAKYEDYINSQNESNESNEAVEPTPTYIASDSFATELSDTTSAPEEAPQQAQQTSEQPQVTEEKPSILKRIVDFFKKLWFF